MPFKLSSHTVFHDKTGYSIITMYSKNKDINHKVENHTNYLYNHCWWILASFSLQFKRSRWRRRRLPQFRSSWCGRTCQAPPVIHRCGLRSNPSGPGAGWRAASWICQEIILRYLQYTRWRVPGCTCNHRRRRGRWRSRVWGLPAGRTEPPPSSSTSGWSGSRHGRSRPAGDCPGRGSCRRRP